MSHLMSLAVILAIMMRPAMRLGDLRMHWHHRLMLEARRPIHHGGIRMYLSRISLRVPVAVATILAIVRRAIAIRRTTPTLLIKLIVPISVFYFITAIIRVPIAVVPIMTTIIGTTIAVISVAIAVIGGTGLMRLEPLFAEHQPVWMGSEL